MRVRSLLCVGILLASPAALAQSTGDWVLARWRGGDYWFPGVVESRDGDKITVAYDDGTREALYLDKVRPYDWSVGSRVSCRWNGGVTWYGAKITAMDRGNGALITLRYDDGMSEQTTTGACRSQ
jgi:hypothetical protein